MPGMTDFVATSVARVYAQAEIDILKMMKDRLGHDGVQEPTYWQEEKLKQARRLRREIEQNTEQKLNDFVDDDLKKALARLQLQGKDAFHDDLEELAGKDRLDSVSHATKDWYKPDYEALVALHEELAGQTKSINRRIARDSEDAFRKCVARGAEHAITGVGTIEEGVQRTLNEFANEGITKVTDQSGRTWQADTYAEMATRTASARAHRQGHMNRAEANGYDLVIVSAHAESCPVCDPWEREVLSHEEDDVYTSVAEAEAEGLFHPNCGHSLATYIPGLSKIDRHLAEPGGEEYEDRQKQRYLERGKRKWERRKAAAVTEEEEAKCQAKINEWDERLDEHVEETGRYREWGREKPGEGDPEQAVKEFGVDEIPDPDEMPEGYEEDPIEEVDEPTNPLKTINQTKGELEESYREARRLTEAGAGPDWLEQQEKIKEKLKGDPDIGKGAMVEMTEFAMPQMAEAAGVGVEELEEHIEWEPGWEGVKAKTIDWDSMAEALGPEQMEQALSGLAEQDMFVENYIDQVKQEWDMHGGKGTPKSEAVQYVLQEEFGLDDAATDHFNYDLDDPEIQAFLKSEGDAVKKVCREMYSNTQEYLEEQGIDSVTVYRGIKFDPEDTPADLADFEFGDVLEKGVVETSTQPLSSFSADAREGAKFAHSSKEGRRGAVMAEEVPRDRVFSLPGTGFGTHGEQEIVVIGGEDAATVVTGSGEEMTGYALGDKDILEEVATDG